MTAAVLSALHLLALGLGLPSVFLRGLALKGPLDPDGLRRLFRADSAWGAAAGLWVVTGVLRAFGGFEKGAAFYLASTLFWTKMALFLLILGLEAWPMWTLIGWRRALRRGQPVDPRHARTLHLVNHVQMALVIAMVFVASFMARGFGASGRASALDPVAGQQAAQGLAVDARRAGGLRDVPAVTAHQVAEVRLGEVP
jgi:putative membrane protein